MFPLCGDSYFGYTGEVTIYPFSAMVSLGLVFLRLPVSQSCIVQLPVALHHIAVAHVLFYKHPDVTNAQGRNI